MAELLLNLLWETDRYDQNAEARGTGKENHSSVDGILKRGGGGGG